MASRYVRSGDAEAAPMQDETIIFHANRNQFTVLNHTAAFVWERLSAPQTVDDLAGALLGAYTGVALETAKVDIERALHELESLGLVVPAA